ncbi:hypothetical protein GTO91_15860 [Heliobacterium undosum]|uniref:Metal-dependent hydrolase n=1 Tax=Heliomicrobium undosum TaxID=121734 RepID=A0A845L4G1_9FIRM|nr:metal-dependent hydrolase [Heliomicrobium undosum]MZP31183.1 hypothetical protein [Heliomicrobium undosum]
MAAGIAGTLALLPPVDGTEELFLSLGLAALGSLLPDLDEPNSVISRRLLPLPVFLRPVAIFLMGVGALLLALTGGAPTGVGVLGGIWLMGAARYPHRTFTHSLVVGLPIVALMALLVEPAWAYPLGSGYLTHVLGDVLHESGVPLFWPVKGKSRTPITLGHRWWGVEPLLQVAAICFSMVLLVERPEMPQWVARFSGLI